MHLDIQAIPSGFTI